MNEKARADPEYDRQAKLLYSLIVAGKSADFTDRALREFLLWIGGHFPDSEYLLPFEMLRDLSADTILQCLKNAHTGNYTKLSRAIAGILAAKLDLKTCTPADLEKIHGIGPKTSRFFIMWVRPEEEYAALDVHVLRWMAACGFKVPKSTPQSRKVYARLEQEFIKKAKKMGLTPRQLDEQIWEAGARRTQKTPLPK